MDKKKVVLYCRVARLPDAERAKECQAARFKELFGYDPIEIYADIGKSGRDNNRPEYRRVIEDALNGKIDYIVVKSLAKFNRDMAAAIKVFRQLRERGVGVFMMNENLDTLNQNPTHEMLIELLEKIPNQYKRGQRNG